MKLSKTIPAAAMTAFVAAAFFTGPPLQAQVTPTTITTLFSDDITAETTETVGESFALRQGQGAAFLLSFSGDGASALNLTLTFDVSLDNTTFTTQAPFTWVVPANGTNAVVAYTNVPPSYLDNIPYVRIRSIATATTNALSDVVLKVSQQHK